jgi:hypothetical protein
MASHIGQMAQIVDRLLAKTQLGQIPWSRSSERGLFQARFDNYLVQIGGTRSPNVSVGSLFGGVVRFKVSTLDGSLIDEINTDPIAASISVFRHQIPDTLKSKLQQLYDLVSDESEDLSSLLRAIG